MDGRIFVMTDRFAEFAAQIGKDFLEPLGYLPWGILAGAVFLLFWRVYGKGKAGWKREQARKWPLFFLTVYLVVIFNLAFFSREPGSRTGVDLLPLGTLNSSLLSQAYFFENILMFIPFGILLPLCFQNFRRGKNCVGAGFVCSVLLETFQLLTQRGYCQLDDVLTNTLGTFLGWLISRKTWKKL